ncbi:hypothetical protein PV783_11790 [Chitinophaga sp. CC14]|uniref:hypothetical protein n=1 Tax=Chitinophaga TaxID=79328 RepID=UPI000DBA6875|nr:hypothetical protein [Chitinophaga ginsengisegetis]MDR6570422.1 hypothetical protein [Chitinophaga ginsengisegetis]MDR6650156.1 hypothetical protein [Chitinophaga ginsengisegetis]MDR6656725.1 hypothetical protein [Chitinophaga ginsengisegetis]
MFSNLAIDVALGLIFIYLLYSLLASVVQELVARIFNSRARLLTKGLRRMLEEDDHSKDLGWFGKFTFFNWFYELGWSVVYFFEPFRKNPFLKKFYSTPSIRNLGENSATSRPAYISPQIFSQTMVHLLRGSVQEHKGTDAQAIKAALTHNYLHLVPDTREHLLQLFEDAGHNTAAFRINMEGWFNETMTRASGWYRKQTQTWLLCMGIAIAALFNVDSIAIARILMKDKNVRSQMVQLAASRAPGYTAITDTLIRKNVLHKDSAFFRADTSVRILVSDTSLLGVYALLRSDAGDAANVLGISRACVTDTTGGHITMRCGYTHPFQQNGWLVFAGWCITALAISLGAPFWFDLLGKVVKFRTTQPPADTPGNNTAATH